MSQRPDEPIEPDDESPWRSALRVVLQIFLWTILWSLPVSLGIALLRGNLTSWEQLRRDAPMVLMAFAIVFLGGFLGLGSIFALMRARTRRHHRRPWEEGTFPEANGRFGGLNIVLRDLPVRRDPATGQAHYASPDFGWEFRGKLNQAIGDLGAAISLLEAGGRLEVTVRLDSGQEVHVAMAGSPARKPSEFDSDLSDALIDAFASAGLTP
jgi:hypothetical protein